MMFKGTERRSAADVNREFDEMGANYNAFTSEENTVYYGAVLPEFQGQLLALLGAYDMDLHIEPRAVRDALLEKLEW